MGMLLDGVLSAAAIDSSGETVDISGANIDDFNEGKAYINYEHQSHAESIIGICKMAKKIFKESECETDRQKMFWKAVGERPYIYLIGELFDSEDVPGAVAAAGMVNYFKNRNEKIEIGWSTEGSTLQREDNILKRTVMRRVAFTLRPCLKLAQVGTLTEKEMTQALKKTSVEIESVDIELDRTIFEDTYGHVDFSDIKKALKELNKTLDAGLSNVAPSQLVGQAALTREYISGSKKNTLKAIVRDWDKKRPLKEVIKAALPEISDTYVDHFVDMAQDLSLKKGEPKLTRINSNHAHFSADDKQKDLVEGLYFDKKQEFNPQHDAYVPDKKLHILRNDKGQDVFLKGPSNLTMGQDQDKQNLNAAHYSQLAHSIFDMSKHVPVTSVIKHPEVHQGASTQAIEYIKGSKTPLESQELWAKAHKKAIEDGSLHKLAIMDHALQNSDRHHGNMLVHPDGHLQNIDNDYAFSDIYMKPEYLEGDNSTIHPEATKWLQGIDLKRLATEMKRQGHDKSTVKKTLTVLQSYKKDSLRPITMQNAWDRAQQVSAPEQRDLRSLLPEGDK